MRAVDNSTLSTPQADFLAPRPERTRLRNGTNENTRRLFFLKSMSSCSLREILLLF